MATDAASFLDLCKQLRDLGATRVECFGFVAEFRPPTQVLAQVPARTKATTPASEPAPERLTAEQLRERKEAGYRKELGL